MDIEKSALKNQLQTNCQAIVEAANTFPDREFSQQTDGKWSVADVMQHLYLSARPVVRLMTGPREVLMQWGNPDEPPRTYDELAATYQKTLATGVKAPANLSPRAEDVQVDRSLLVTRLTDVYQALTIALDDWTDHELDQYVIPHPVLGKLSVREMLFFTSIHTRHHLKQFRMIE